MEDYSYVKSPKGGAIFRLVVSVLMLLMNLYFIFYSNYIWWSFIPIPIILFSIYVGIQLYLSSENWEIYVTEDRFKWNSPNGLGIGKSFDLKINEIEKLCISRGEDISYYVKTNDGRKIFLSQNSNIDFDSLFLYLEKKGVKIEST